MKYKVYASVTIIPQEGSQEDYSSMREFDTGHTTIELRDYYNWEYAREKIMGELEADLDALVKKATEVIRRSG
jgi:hypothetical protein